MSPDSPSGSARAGKLVLGAIVVLYLISFGLPVFDNGRLNHMDPRPQGLVSGWRAFCASGDLLVNLLIGSPLTAGLETPQLPYLWLALAWIANPLFWAAAGLLAWRKNKLAAIAATAAILPAWNAQIALRDEAVVVARQFQSGYWLWMGSIVLLIVTALWRAARGTAAQPRPLVRTAVIAGSACLLTGAVVAAGHWWSATRLTLPPPAMTAEDFAARMKSADREVRLAALRQRVYELGEQMPWSPSATASAAEREQLQTDIAHALLRAVDDPDPEIRATACLWLGSSMLGSTVSPVEAIPALMRQLSDENADVRLEAAKAIVTLPPVDGRRQIEREAAWETLADLLTHGSRDQKNRVLDERLIRAPGDGAQPLLPAIATRLDDPDPHIRFQAIWMLQRMGPSGAQEAIRALSDSDPRVVKLAVEAAETLGPEARSHLPELGRLVRQGDGSVRHDAARILVKIGPDAVPELMKALDADDFSTRRLAAESLGDMGAAAVAALPKLDTLAKETNSYLAPIAAQAAERIRAAQSAPVAPQAD